MSEEEEDEQGEPLFEVTERSQSLFSELISPEDQVSVPEWKKKI